MHASLQSEEQSGPPAWQWLTRVAVSPLLVEASRTGSPATLLCHCCWLQVVLDQLTFGPAYNLAFMAYSAMVVHSEWQGAASSMLQWAFSPHATWLLYLTPHTKLAAPPHCNASGLMSTPYACAAAQTPHCQMPTMPPPPNAANSLGITHISLGSLVDISAEARVLPRQGFLCGLHVCIGLQGCLLLPSSTSSSRSTLPCSSMVGRWAQ